MRFEGDEQKSGHYIHSAGLIYAISLLCLACLYSCSSSVDNNSQTSQGILQNISSNEKTGQTSVITSQENKGIQSVIEGLIITPEHPTVRNNLKVEIKSANIGDRKIIYEYHWQINGKPIVEEYGNILPQGLFRKRDRISITVVPVIDGNAYKDYGYTSNVFIYSAPPDLSLNEDYNKSGSEFEFQLNGKDPDGDSVTYALEQPVPAGMTIDKETGKIKWKPIKPAKGSYKFVASATDSDGSKTIKTFEFNADFK